MLMNTIIILVHGINHFLAKRWLSTVFLGRSSLHYDFLHGVDIARTDKNYTNNSRKNENKFHHLNPIKPR